MDLVFKGPLSILPVPLWHADTLHATMGKHRATNLIVRYVDLFDHFCVLILTKGTMYSSLKEGEYQEVK